MYKESFFSTPQKLKESSMDHRSKDELKENDYFRKYIFDSCQTNHRSSTPPQLLQNKFPSLIHRSLAYRYLCPPSSLLASPGDYTDLSLLTFISPLIVLSEIPTPVDMPGNLQDTLTTEADNSRSSLPPQFSQGHFLLSSLAL